MTENPNHNIWMQLVAQSYLMLRLQHGEAKEAVAEYAVFVREILGVVAAEHLASQELTNRAKRKRLERLVRKIRSDTERFFREMERRRRQDYPEIARHAERGTVGGINAAIGAEFLQGRLPKREVDQVIKSALVTGRTIGEWWNRQGTTTADRIVKELRLGWVGGEGTEAIARRIRGTVLGTNQQISILTRTAMATIQSQMRQAVLRMHADVIAAQQWISTLDRRTTVICLARSGNLYTLEGEPIGHEIPFLGGPPVHMGCRSDLIPVIKPLDEMSTKYRKRLPPNFRASALGPLRGDISAHQFLKLLPAEDARRMLGATKYRLWRSGRIKLQQLLDPTGREIRVRELRRLYDDAA